MNEKIILYFLLCILVACSNDNAQKEFSVSKYLNSGDSICDDPIKFSKYAEERNSKKDTIISCLLESLGDKELANYKYIQRVYESETFKFKNSLDNFKIFSITLNDVPSNVWKYNYSVISNETKKTFCVLDISESYNVNFNGDGCLVSGCKENRSKGRFCLYDYINGEMVNVFKTPQFIINKSSECLIFQPFQLLNTYDDFNKDGFTDIQFKGNYLYFCDGLQEGPNYYDGDSIKKHGVIRYIYTQNPKAKNISFSLDSSLSILPK